MTECKYHWYIWHLLACLFLFFSPNLQVLSRKLSKKKSDHIRELGLCPTKLLSPNIFDHVIKGYLLKISHKCYITRLSQENRIKDVNTGIRVCMREMRKVENKYQYSPQQRPT